MNHTFEASYWGDCCNTFDEDQKHYVYARYMGLDRSGYSFDVHGKSIIDIGGGPTSMLLKTINLGERATVIDPLKYPEWTYQRYAAKGIKSYLIRGEDLVLEHFNTGYPFAKGYDEAWIYNCLQHTDDPERIIKNALSAAKSLRIFEWVDIPPHEGHPIELRKDNLDQWTGQSGHVIKLSESGCYGTAYYNQIIK